jgi:tRNA A-37 threonylcarbamoyl transferase component Bud32
VGQVNRGPNDRAGDRMTSAGMVAIDGVRWSFASAGRDFLSDDDLQLSHQLKAGRATVVKDGKHRTVYRLSLQSGDVYWKVCRLYGPRAWWRDFFRGPKAKLEFDRARELADRGVPTVEPLACGRMGGFWPPASHLITRALDATTPLDDYLLVHPPQLPEGRRRLAVALAKFMAKLHDAGVTHPDLHPGNLLVRDRGDGLEFFLIDVHDVRLGPPLDRAARRANLTMLNRWFQIRASRADRLRFWRAYAGPDGSPEDDRQIERDTERSILGLWSSRDIRCRRANRHFQKVSAPGVRGFAVREMDAGMLHAFIADPDEPFGRPEAVVLKDSRSATVCRLAIPGVSAPLVYKRFRVTEWTDPFANIFRRSGAMRSWTAGNSFIDRGLPTPRPWLVLHRQRLGVPTVGYLLCEEVPDARHLDEVIPTADRTARRELTERLARWVRLMHERGASHRDLKAANILVTAAGECQFIDLVGVRLRRNVGRALRVRDLARLNASFVSSPGVSRTDRLRFLRVYLLWGLRGPAGWKEWWSQIALATRDKIRKNALRNRPLG